MTVKVDYAKGMRVESWVALEGVVVIKSQMVRIAIKTVIVKVDTVKAMVQVSLREFVKIRKVLMVNHVTQMIIVLVTIASPINLAFVKVNAVIGTETLVPINVL